MYSMRRSSIMIFLVLMDTETWIPRIDTSMKVSLRSGGPTPSTIRTRLGRLTSYHTLTDLTLTTQSSTVWLLTYFPQPPAWEYGWNGVGIGRISRTTHTLN